jgi:hypothetical protein
VDSRAVRHPVGPLPGRVYWTRRIVLLAVVAIVVIVIAVSCSGGSGPGRGAGASPTRSTSPSSSTPTVSALVCRRDQLAVTADTDADTYPAGALPRLRISVRNTGSAPCTLTESPSTRSWTIFSGPDQVWTTVGCTTAHNATQTTLAVGASARHTFVWNRHRSGKQCAASTVVAGPGTYQLTVAVNGITSAPGIFHLRG